MKNKIAFIIYTLLTFSILSTNFYFFYDRNINIKHNIIDEQAKSLTALIIAVRESYQEVFVKNHVKIDEQTLEFLPIKRTPDIAKRFSKLNHSITIRTVSDRPRNPNNKANSEEIKIINYFKENPNQQSFYNDKDSLYNYAEPLYIENSCLKCHGKKEDVIPSIRDKYNTAYDYKLGELRGIVSFKIDKSLITQDLDSNFHKMLMTAIVIYLILLVFGYLLMKAIVRNEKNFKENLRRKVTEKTSELVGLNKKLKVENETIVSLNEKLSQHVEELVVTKESIEKQNEIIIERESRIEILLNTFSEGLYINDTNYNLTYINEPLQKKIGDVVGKKCHKAIYNLDEKCEWCMFEDLKTKKHIEYEHIFEDKVLSIRNTLLEDNSKLTIFNDITERKKTEQYLKESEERYKTIFQSSFTGISILANDGTHIDTNPNSEDIHGYSRDELLGIDAKNFTFPEDIKKSQDAFQAIISGEKTKVEIDIRLLHKDTNNIVWVHSMFTKYVQDNNSKDSGVLVVFQDITKQKEIEKIIAENEEKFRRIINSANEAVILIDNDEKIALWNNAAVKIFGYTKEEMIGKNLHNILPPEKYRDTAHNAFALFRKSGRGNAINKTLELEGLRKDGEIFPIDLSLSAIRIKGKWNAVGIIKDISIRKEQEVAIKESKNKIEIAHKDITDNINYAKTIQKALLSSNKKVSSYISNFFILFEPKDQVSGDFYYINKFNNNIIFAVVDSTGHGVSGGFMSMLGITHLQEIIGNKRVSNPAQALNGFRKKVKHNFKMFGSENFNGFDVVLCAFDAKTNTLDYSGANRPLWIIRNNKLLEYKPTRNPIGFYPTEIEFTNVKIQLEKDDLLYLFSDGYVDQFGGVKDKKFGKKQFKELLLSINKLSLREQKEILKKEFNKWKGNQEQIDDVTIFCIKV